MSARDDYPDPCSTTDQDAMYDELDSLRAILGPLVRPSSSQSPEDFAYELGWAALGEALGDDDGCEAARAMGNSIVRTEEMQAIRLVLNHLAIRCAMEAGAPTRDVLRLLGLQDTVIDWVISA